VYARMVLSVSASRIRIRLLCANAGVIETNNGNSKHRMVMATLMTLNKTTFPEFSGPEFSGRKSSLARRIRQFVGTLVLWLILGLSVAACGLMPEDDGIRGTVGLIEGFIGGVAADEPRAALVGRDVLSAGGNASDVAVAMYFTLAVTLPSAASLGGGGVCMVHDAASQETQVLDFLAMAPRDIPGSASRPSAIPGNPRGFFALHAKYGELRWETLVAPAGNLARFGTPVSRALAHDINAAGSALHTDREFMKIFSNPETGGLVQEGEIIRQLELSAILTQMTSKGPGDFYGGQTARLIVDGAIRAGGSLSADDMRDFKPVWREPLRVDAGDSILFLPQPPAAAGAVAGSMWYMMTEDDRFEDAEPDEQSHVLAEAGMRAYADRARWMLDDSSTRWSVAELMDFRRLDQDMESYNAQRHTAVGGLAQSPVPRRENPSGTSFIAVDKDGGAVACALSMNNMFGTGRVAPGTGIVLSTIPDNGGQSSSGRGATSLVPSLIINENTNKFYWAGAATGGVTAPTALMNVLARSYLGEGVLRGGMDAKRVHHGGYPDITYFERGLDPSIIAALKAGGHQTTEVKSIGRVNAFMCFEGLPEFPNSCDVAHDPRGFGLSFMAEGL
jgi:gamma-glutamyltranspeptidase / glutathione hydrolase